MISAWNFPSLRIASTLTLLFSVAPPTSSVHAEVGTGTLRLSIHDAETGKPVPSRVEIRGADGAYYVAQDALPAHGDCAMGDPDSGPVDRAASTAPFSDRVRLDNPYTATAQFYSSGQSSIRLPKGSATIRVFKGPEFKVGAATIEIADGTTLEHRIDLTRWIDMPKKGWYSADDHLHIPRPKPESNPGISRMLQAEDIHVGNLLQMGKVTNFEIASQYAHGPDGVYQEGNFILAAGQENPRTHFLGHTITLGAAGAHFDEKKYLVYRRLWEKTAKEGAIHGYAHLVAPSGFMISPEDGIAVVLPHNLLHFAEVLQFNRSGYQTWYDLLDLGFRITATAGSDYPCGGQSIPGHERFYTNVAGPLTYPKWIESVRRGRTFVTTGPVVEFRVNGQEIGGEIVLEKPSSVVLEGSVVFDPERDDVAAVELLQNGEVVERYSRLGSQARIEFRVERRVDEASWFAVRAYGARIDENVFVTPLIFSSFESTSNVHTSPIYVSTRNQPGIGKSARSRAVAQSYLARLVDLERLLAEDNIDAMAAKLAEPTMDAVPKVVFLSSRPDLLDEIREAKKFFQARLQ